MSSFDSQLSLMKEIFQFLVVSVVFQLVVGISSAHQFDQEQNKAEASLVGNVLYRNESPLVRREQSTFQDQDKDQEVGISEGYGKTRRKRSFGLLAALMERVMQSEAVQDEMEEEEIIDDEDDVLEVVRCSLVLDRRSCRITDEMSMCTNYYERKCFLYIYPKLETIAENSLPQQ